MPQRMEEAGAAPLISYALAIALWWREILLCGVAAAVLGAIGIFALDVLLPKYTASTDVAISGRKSEVAIDKRFTAVNSDLGRRSRSARQAALVGLVHKPDLARKVHAQLQGQLDEDATPAALLELVDAELVTLGMASTRPESDLIRISANASSPGLAKSMADAWTEAFIADVNLLYEDVPAGVVETVQAELADVRRRYLEAEERLKAYTAASRVDLLDQQIAGMKMATKPGTAECVHLTEEGCAVYEDRPAACRYYALGSMGVRKKGAAEVEDVYFVVREEHCLGHEEPHTQTVAEYRTEQGLDRYDAMNRAWRDLVLKKRSAGPTVGAPSPRSLQLFDMCSYDLDGFRAFLQSPGFRRLVELPADEERALLDDEERLLEFAMRFLAQVLFGERSIPLREGARERRVEERREQWRARRDEQVRRHRESEQRRRYGG